MATGSKPDSHNLGVYWTHVNGSHSYIGPNASIAIKLEDAGYKEHCKNSDNNRRCVWYHPNDNDMPFVEIDNGNLYIVEINDGNIHKIRKVDMN